MKKVSKDFVGLCMVGELRKGMLFRRVAGTHVSNKIYELVEYDRATKKYLCAYWEDISRAIFLKGSARCTTDI